MRAARGFSLVELIVSLAAALSAVAVLGALAAASQRIQAVVPDASDMQQRLRVAAGAVVALLGRAGADPAGDDSAAAVARSIPPLFPHRRGPTGPDPELSAYVDRLSVVRVSEAAASAPLDVAMASPASHVQLAITGGCVGATACRFAIGDRAIVADDTGAFDLFAVSGLGVDTLAHVPFSLAQAFTPVLGARVGAVRVEAIAWDPAAAVLRSYVDASGGQPLVDDVVGFSVRYFADAVPPPRPKPPPGVASCLFDAAGQPRLPVLAATHGALAELTPAMLVDGPACGVAPQRFDADLYRVRQVRVTIRVQASSASRRGRDPSRYVHPGTADESQAWPDLELTLDVTAGARRMS